MIGKYVLNMPKDILVINIRPCIFLRPRAFYFSYFAWMDLEAFLDEV